MKRIDYLKKAWLNLKKAINMPTLCRVCDSEKSITRVILRDSRKVKLCVNCIILADINDQVNWGAMGTCTLKTIRSKHVAELLKNVEF